MGPFQRLSFKISTPTPLTCEKRLIVVTKSSSPYPPPNPTSESIKVERRGLYLGNGIFGPLPDNPGKKSPRGVVLSRRPVGHLRSTCFPSEMESRNERLLNRRRCPSTLLLLFTTVGRGGFSGKVRSRRPYDSGRHKNRSGQTSKTKSLHPSHSFPH